MTISLHEIPGRSLPLTPGDRPLERERLFFDHAHLVRPMASELHARSRTGRFAPEEDDLIQAGYLGLLRAVNWTGRHKDHDPRKGPFWAWARIWIRQALSSCIYRGGYGRIASAPLREQAILCRARRLRPELHAARAEEPECEIRESVERLEAALLELDPRAREIVSRHWGLGGTKKLEFQQMRLRHGLSVAEIRGIHDAALRKLRVRLGGA